MSDLARPAMDKIPEPAISDILEVRALSIRFGGLQALDQISFKVAAGEILALIGPNGAGKSTLLNIVSGAMRPDSGEVLLKGKRIDGLSAERVNARGLARTFQGAEVLRLMSVRENVMAAGAGACGIGIVQGLLGTRRSHEAMKKLGSMADQHLAFVGLQQEADREAATLSAGQQRLLALARALATGAELLILDEPGAGLNATEKDVLVNVIERLRGLGKTIVFVEHDLGFVGALAERMVVLDHGKLIAVGAPDAVRRDPAVIEAYLGNTDIAVRPKAYGGYASHSAALSIRAAHALLETRGLVVRYGGLTAVNSVSLAIGAGEIVAVVGANGAGKSTLLKSIAGAVPLAAGQIVFDGADLAPIAGPKRVGRGLALAPEGRQLFPTLSVRENLGMGHYSRLRLAGLRNLLLPTSEAGRELERAVAEVFAFFPRLAEREAQLAGTLSGGEGQMLAIGRALMSRPRLLMLDEPSFGLAPQIAKEILEALPRLADTGVAILLVEQNARAALQISHRAYVLVNGVISAEGASAELLADKRIAQAYLGLEPALQGEAARPVAAIR